MHPKRKLFKKRKSSKRDKRRDKKQTTRKNKRSTRKMKRGGASSYDKYIDKENLKGIIATFDHTRFIYTLEVTYYTASYAQGTDYQNVVVGDFIGVDNNLLKLGKNYREDGYDDVVNIPILRIAKDGVKIIDEHIKIPSPKKNPRTNS